MSDATREQVSNETFNKIANDAEAWANKYYYPLASSSAVACKGYEVGASVYHQIGVKEGYNQAIEDIIKLTRQCQGHFGTRGDVHDFIIKLENMKKP